jgi:carboxylesterase
MSASASGGRSLRRIAMTKWMKRGALVGLLTVTAASGIVGLACTPIDVRPGTMDDAETRDPALDSPEAFLVSAKYPSPTERQKQTPVVIAAHGFQASTYEWVEFQRYAEARGVLFSNVLLGGHGRNTEVWSRSTWREWAEPLVAEYERLSALGFENISVFCSSTGCTLTLTSLAEGALANVTPMKNLVMVAPFLVPQNELLYQARVVGPVIWNLPSAQTAREEEMFYHNRPYVVFIELVDAITAADNALAAGAVPFPAGAKAFIFRADEETTVAPVSADKIIAGLGATDGVELIEYESKHHIFTRKDGRKSDDQLTAEERELGIEPWSELDEENYRSSFSRFMARLGVDDAPPAGVAE